MFGTLVRCSVAAVASIALLVAFVSTPEGFTQARKPTRTARGKSRHSQRGRDQRSSGNSSDGKRATAD